MSDNILHIETVAQMHEIIGFPKPKHPLITLLDISKMKHKESMVNQKISSQLYSIAIKDGACGMLYGRNHYDFSDGVLIFTAPNQVFAPTKEMVDSDQSGWMLLFHPDLIRRTPLAEQMDLYTFFSYDVHEALHLSEEEQTTITDVVTKIEEECTQRIDNHSHKVIVSSLELLLNYCSRYYERQFNTRTTQHKDVVSDVERLLKEYFNSEHLEESGLPSVQYFAEQVHLSANYLGDLMKKETGRSIKDHINGIVVEKAKTLLLGSNHTVSEIAYSLGFNYPHYFSRMFKSQTGSTPQEYRLVN